MINRKKSRGYHGQVQKSSMGVCRSKVWWVVLSSFAIWSVLICLNYSSLMDSVARLYVYSVNYAQPLQIISIPDDTASIKISENLEEKTEGNARETDGKTGENDRETDEKGREYGRETDEKQGYDEIDELMGINITELVEKSDRDQPVESEEKSDRDPTIETVPKENPQQIPVNPKRRRRRGKAKRRRPSKSVANTEEGAASLSSNTGETKQQFSPSPPPPPPPPPRKCVQERTYDQESCAGRYIFIQTLPRRFNVDLLRDCKSLDLWMDMCQYVRNSGLGPALPNSDRVFSEHGWFATNQFLLEVIFHNRMQQYECLTDDSSKASAIFVPFYAGLDVARHLWNTDSDVRDSGGFELVKLLKRKPEWKKWWGRDHFFVAGRITWDFRRSSNAKDPDWGTQFLYLPEVRNMTGLVIESSPWNNNDFGIPYPTYFHPANDEEVFQWQNRMRKQGRVNLFCFAGAPRPDRPDSIRNQLISQCEKSEKCLMIHCNNWKNKCHKPAELMKMFQSSDFCLQPPGDSYTRRSTFDSILAGCIPVFFHPGSAYIQYLWHFPREFTKYSVFIPLYDVRDEKVSIQSVLEKIPAQTVAEMREEIIKLIPKIIYADPRCRLETLEDAFDVTVKGVLERVERIKQDMKEGSDESFGYDERQAWKYRWLGKLEPHVWDPYFSGSFHTRNFTNF